jgi:undecaprenyl phosphate-alpha-L-ara4N flippase subunit ArnE
MLQLILLAFLQAFCLCAGQVLLKIAMTAMPPFSWTWMYFGRLATNWWLLACGISFTAAGVLWMYILRHFPFSHAYPLVSMAYVFGMIIAIFVFHESVHWNQWVGVLLIMGGCFMIAQ